MPTIEIDRSAGRETGISTWGRTRLRGPTRNPARALLLAALLLQGVLATAQENGAGPFSLFLTYTCPPQTRAAFRAHMAEEGVRRFERWKQQGVYADYLVLFSSFVNAADGAHDMLIRLDFVRYTDSGRWKDIERTMPGGLSEKELRLCTPARTLLADLADRSAPAAHRDPASAVYLFIPYHLEKGIGKGDYRKYFEAYVKPQNEAWLAAGALSGWGLYFNQHAAGAAWDLAILYEYTELAALARRDEVKQAARATLRNDPAWKAASDNKQSFRTEGQVVIMDRLLPAATR